MKYQPVPKPPLLTNRQMAVIFAAIVFMILLVAAFSSKAPGAKSYTAEEIEILNQVGISPDSAAHHHYTSEDLATFKRVNEDWRIYARDDVNNRLEDIRRADGTKFDARSSKFTWGKINKETKTVCGTVNFKNVAGQYLGPKRFMAERTLQEVRIQGIDEGFDGYWKRYCE